MRRFSRWLWSWSSRRTLFVTLVALVVVLDQITKFWAVGALTRAFDTYGGGSLGFGDKLDRFLSLAHPGAKGVVTVIPGFWDFQYAENPGAAFSFLASFPSAFRTPFFLVVSLAAMVFIVVYFRRTTGKQLALRVALALVFGGALGNVIDRVRFGYVIDFIRWHWHGWAWPTFNIADAAITVGIGLMLLDMALSPKPASARPASAVNAKGS